MVEQRKSLRTEYQFEATIILDGQSYSCQIRNLSDNGALVAIHGDADLVPEGASQSLRLGDMGHLTLPHHHGGSVDRVQHGFAQSAKIVRLFSFEDGKIGLAMSW